MRFWSMSPETNRPRTILSWLFLGGLFILCGVLGVFQYRLIGEVSDAARERLRFTLQAGLFRFSSDFSSELSTAARAIAPVNAQNPRNAAELLPARYEQWRRTSRHSPIFRRVALAVPRGNGLAFENLDLATGKLEAADWPEDWTPLKQRIERMIWPEDRAAPAPGAPPERDVLVFEVPILGSPESPGPPGRPGNPRPPFGRREIGRVIFEPDIPYLRDTLLPELVQRELPDYQVAVVSKTGPSGPIYESEPGDAARISGSADASIDLFDMSYDSRPPGGPPRGRGPGGGGFGPGAPGRGFRPGPGRWRMFVRNRAGSLEAVVTRARRLNLALTTGVLLLLLASVVALIRFTQRAQKLAELQMGFVAGVSHELRTPLTVIHTAGYNLQGKMAQNPAQVERYGALIQKESGRLKDLVEQVLRFAGAEAGRLIHEPEPLSVESVIDQTMESSKAVIDDAQCVIEKTIEPGLPPIAGDPMALKHALQNLLSNAAKYGTRKGSNWIGIFASRATEHGRNMVEIRVADRGPGIPAAEQARIFDPFFRGQSAVQAQVHGTGLGLNLVKKIVEAHGGTIQVKSEPMKGAEFIVRIPEAAGASG